MLTKFAARVRGLFQIDTAEDREDVQVQINTRNDLLVAQALPPYAEIVRMGRTWQVRSASGVAALTAAPGTTAGLSLYNGDLNTLNVLIIEEFGSDEEVIDATQADTTAIYAMNNKTVVSPPADAGLTIRSMSGRSGYDGKARTVAAGTVVNDGWFPHGPQAPLAPAVAGANWKINVCPCAGLYMVVPGGQFNIVAVKAGAAAAAQQFYYIRFHEATLKYRS